VGCVGGCAVADVVGCDGCDVPAEVDGVVGGFRRVVVERGFAGDGFGLVGVVVVVVGGVLGSVEGAGAGLGAGSVGGGAGCVSGCVTVGGGTVAGSGGFFLWQPASKRTTARVIVVM